MSQTTELFIVAAVWTLVVAVGARFIPNWPGRIAAFAVLVGIPFWELPYGYYNFQRFCRQEISPQLYEKLIPQDSICVEFLDGGLFRGLIAEGFSRIELVGKSDDPGRDSASGRVFTTPRVDVQSQYCVQFENNIALPWRVSRSDTLITRANDRHVVVRQSQFRWAGMWWQESARPVLGTGGRCFDEPFRAIRYVRTGAG